MNEYEVLLEQAAYDDIEVIENYGFGDGRIKGLYCDGVIALSNKIDTNTERKCILAEEIGHHLTSVGNITDLSQARNRKQERVARLYAYNNQIGLMGLVQAYKHGCHSLNDTANYLDVTEEFLVEAAEHYSSKYGLFTEIDNYIIVFEPCLAVIEKIQIN